MSTAVGGPKQRVTIATYITATQGGQCSIRLREELFKVEQKNSKDGVLDASVSDANERRLTNAATSDGTNPHLTAELRNKTIKVVFFFLFFSFGISSRTNGACV